MKGPGRNGKSMIVLALGVVLLSVLIGYQGFLGDRDEASPNGEDEDSQVVERHG